MPVNRSDPFQPEGRKCVRPGSFPVVISGNILAKEFFIFKPNEWERETDLELGIVAEKSLKQHGLGPKNRPLAIEYPGLGWERGVKGKRDVVNVDDDASAQPRQDLEEEIGDVAVDLQRVRRIDKQHITRAQY